MNEKEKLFNDLQARLEGESIETSVNAVCVLFVSYIVALSLVSRKEAKRLVVAALETINKEAGWML